MGHAEGTRSKIQRLASPQSATLLPVVESARPVDATLVVNNRTLQVHPSHEQRSLGRKYPRYPLLLPSLALQRPPPASSPLDGAASGCGRAARDSGGRS